MHRRATARWTCPHPRTKPGTWQTLRVHFIGAILRIIGWNFRMRRMQWGLRIKQYLTLAAVMASVGTAVGYVVATRDAPGEESFSDPDEAP